MNRVKNKKGLGLVELFIALAITAILVSAGLNMYLTQHKSWIIQEHISDMQQNARFTMRELTQRIRMAGYGLPSSFNPIVAANADPDIITVYYKSDPACEATLTQNMPGKSSLLKFDDQDLSCFNPNTQAFILDPTTSTGEIFFVPDVDKPGKQMWHLPSELTKQYPAGSIVMQIEVFTFYLDKADPQHPKFMRIGSDTIPQVFAENIEDLQFVYGLADGAYTDSPPIGRVIREVNIALTARTEKEDLQFKGQYRTRNYVTNVKVRNLGLK